MMPWQRLIPSNPQRRSSERPIMWRKMLNHAKCYVFSITYTLHMSRYTFCLNDFFARVPKARRKQMLWRWPQHILRSACGGLSTHWTRYPIHLFGYARWYKAMMIPHLLNYDAITLAILYDLVYTIYSPLISTLLVMSISICGAKFLNTGLIVYICKHHNVDRSLELRKTLDIENLRTSWHSVLGQKDL